MREEEGWGEGRHHGEVNDAVLLHQRAGEGCVGLEHVGAVFFIAQSFFLVAVNGHAEHFAGGRG